MAFKDLFILKEATGSRYENPGELLDADAGITAGDVAETDIDFSQLPAKEGVVSAQAVYGTAGVEPPFNGDIRNIEGFLNSLPGTMEEETKKTSLAGILAAAQFHTGDLLDDYSQRMNTLERFLEDDTQRSAGRLRGYEQDIAKMLALIEELKSKIADEDARMKQQRAVVEEEMARLAALKQYL